MNKISELERRHVDRRDVERQQTELDRRDVERQQTDPDRRQTEPERRCEQVAGARAGLPLAGAVLGLCVGGPVGIIAGAKLGSLAAIGGSILGYTGASIIREQREMRRLLLAHTEAQPRPPSEDSVSVSVSDRPAKRMSKKVRVKEEPMEKEEEEKEDVMMICPPHLLTRQWRRLTDVATQESIVALIKDVEVVRPEGDRERSEAVTTVTVTAVVSSIPEDVT